MSGVAGGQKQKLSRTHDQSVFTMEGVPVSKPVDLPESALQVLRKNKFVLSCLEGGQTPEDIPEVWFVASKIHLGETQEMDLVVQPRELSVAPASNGCLFRQLYERSTKRW
jgi:hypothetical protein